MISSFGALAQGSLQLIKRLSLQGMEGMIKESTDPEEQAIRHAFKTCGFAYSVAGNTLLSSDIRSSLSTPFGLDRTNSSASASTLLPRTLSEEIRLDSSFARDDELVQMEINSYVSEIWNTQTKKMHAVADVEPLGKIIITIAPYKSAFMAFVRTRLGFKEVDFRDIDCGISDRDPDYINDKKRFKQALREYVELYVKLFRSKLVDLLACEDLAKTLDDVLSRFEGFMSICSAGSEDFDAIEDAVKRIRQYRAPSQCLIDFYTNGSEFDIPNLERLFGVPTTQYIRFEDGETLAGLNIKQSPKKIDVLPRPEFKNSHYRQENLKYALLEVQKKYEDLCTNVSRYQDIKHLLIADFQADPSKSAMTSSEIRVCFPNIDDLEHEVTSFSVFLQNILKNETYEGFERFIGHLERFEALVLQYLALSENAKMRFEPFVTADANSEGKTKRFIQLFEEYVKSLDCPNKVIDLRFMHQCPISHIPSTLLILTRLLTEYLPPSDPLSLIFENIVQRAHEVNIRMENAQTIKCNHSILFTLRDKIRTEGNSLDDIISAERSYLTDWTVRVGNEERTLMVFNDMMMLLRKAEMESPRKRNNERGVEAWKPLVLERKLKLDSTFVDILDGYTSGQRRYEALIGSAKKPLSSFSPRVPVINEKDFYPLVNMTTEDPRMVNQLRHVISTCQYLGDRRAAAIAKLYVNEQGCFRVYSRVFEQIGDNGKLRPSPACILCCSDKTSNADMEEKLRRLGSIYEFVGIIKYSQKSRRYYWTIWAKDEVSEKDKPAKEESIQKLDTVEVLRLMIGLVARSHISTFRDPLSLRSLLERELQLDHAFHTIQPLISSRHKRRGSVSSIASIFTIGNRHRQKSLTPSVIDVESASNQSHHSKPPLFQFAKGWVTKDEEHVRPSSSMSMRLKEVKWKEDVGVLVDRLMFEIEKRDIPMVYREVRERNMATLFELRSLTCRSIPKIKTPSLIAAFFGLINEKSDELIVGEHVADSIINDVQVYSGPIGGWKPAREILDKYHLLESPTFVSIFSHFCRLANNKKGTTAAARDIAKSFAKIMFPALKLNNIDLCRAAGRTVKGSPGGLDGIHGAHRPPLDGSTLSDYEGDSNTSSENLFLSFLELLILRFETILRGGPKKMEARGELVRRKTVMARLPSSFSISSNDATPKLPRRVTMAPSIPHFSSMDSAFTLRSTLLQNTEKELPELPVEEDIDQATAHVVGEEDSIDMIVEVYGKCSTTKIVCEAIEVYKPEVLRIASPDLTDNEASFFKLQ